jgi:hypothetical protein
MKSLIVAAGLIACATPGHTAEKWPETWSCTHSSPIDNQPTVTRFEVSPLELIEAKSHQTYRIERNNDYGIVAISSISTVEEGHKDPTVGAVSIVINKISGEFLVGFGNSGGTARHCKPTRARKMQQRLEGTSQFFRLHQRPPQHLT